MKNLQITIVAVLFAVTGCQNQSKNEEQKNKPNIVILYADDMGYGDMSCQNPNSKIQTPNLDKLASEGMRFTDAHSSSGICSPSRFALLTGTYHWRRQHNIINALGQPDFFRPGDLTLPQMLKNNGYATAAIGKWHLGWDWESIKTEAGKQFEGKIANKPEHYDWSKEIPGGPLDRGFDSYFGDGTINFPPYCWVENNKVTEVPSEMLALGKLETKEGNWEFRPGPMVKDWNPYKVLPTLAKRAVEVVTQQSAEKPFFLYFAFPSPHAPIIPNDEFIGKTQAGGFGDFVYQTDYIIGQVLEALKQKGLDENTIVLFSADNGPERYAFDRIQNYDHSSMGELRGLKRDTWEGGHRIPFIVKWPGFVKAGAVSHEVINQVDIMRTLANIIGAEIPNDAAVDSYNLLPVWKGESYKKPLREATVQNTYEERYALRQGDWLLINSFSGEHSKAPDWYNTNNAYIRYDKDSGEGLLFNLKEDVSQKNNLFEKHPEKVTQMRDLLKKYRNSGRSVAVQ